MVGMNMKKYMTFTVSWEKFKQDSEELNTGIYEDPVDCKCYIYGKNIYIREDNQEAPVSAKVYLTLDEVKVKDRLDGQVVKSVNSYPESWNSKVQLYECLIWRGGFDYNI